MPSPVTRPMPPAAQAVVAAVTAGCLATMAVQFIRSGGCSGGLVPYDSPPRRTAGFRIDPNTASRAELLQLPGVGPRTADRILGERSRRGGFASIEDLGDVPGIGGVTLDRMRPFLISPSTPTAAEPHDDVRTREPLPAGR